MPITIHIDDDTPVLVELKKRRGEQEVSINARDLLEKSSEALESAMAAIYGVARRVVGTIKALPLAERPSEVETEFGLFLTTDAKAFVVNAGMEAQIKVTLKWKHHISENDGTNE